MSRRAFTLLELILVLAVIGFLTAVAAARLGGLRSGQTVEQAATRIADQIGRCQGLAAGRSQAVRLRLDLDTRRSAVALLAPGGESDPPDGQEALNDLADGSDALALAFTPDGGATTTSGAVDLLFLPDGICAAPGLITLALGERRAGVRCHLGPQPATREQP